MVIGVIADAAPLGPNLGRGTRVLSLSDAKLEKSRCGAG
jgi:hypothetical protein